MDQEKRTDLIVWTVVGLLCVVVLGWSITHPPKTYGKTETTAFQNGFAVATIRNRDQETSEERYRQPNGTSGFTILYPEGKQAGERTFKDSRGHVLDTEYTGRWRHFCRKCGFALVEEAHGDFAVSSKSGP